MASNFKSDFQTQRQVTENITVAESLAIIENGVAAGFTKATILCSKCHAQVTPTAKFCGSCGTSLGGAAELQHHGQPVLGSKVAMLGGQAVDISKAIGQASAAQKAFGGKNPAAAALAQHNAGRKPMIDLTK